MSEWIEYIIKTKMHQKDPNAAHYLIKLVTRRAKADEFFFNYYPSEIRVRFKNLENPTEISDLLVQLSRPYNLDKIDERPYERNHIVELTTKASRLVMDFDVKISDPYTLSYLLHCIAENLGLGPKEELALYQDLVKRLKKKVEK